MPWIFSKPRHALSNALSRSPQSKRLDFGGNGHDEETVSARPGARDTICPTMTLEATDTICPTMTILRPFEMLLDTQGVGFLIRWAKPGCWPPPNLIVKKCVSMSCRRSSRSTSKQIPVSIDLSIIESILELKKRETPKDCGEDPRRHFRPNIFPASRIGEHDRKKFNSVEMRFHARIIIQVRMSCIYL